MILSSEVVDDILTLSAEGETKTVTVLTDASNVPHSTFYDMPDGFAPWLTVTVSDNVFSFKANNNLFSDSPRSVNVRLHCQPTVGAVWQKKDISVTQAKDSLSVTFSPSSIAVNTPAGGSSTVTVTGVPDDALPLVSSPDWVTTDVVSNSEITVNYAPNPHNEQRNGTIHVSVSGRVFYLPISQDANTANVSFDVQEIVTDYQGKTVTVEVDGLPDGMAVNVVSSETWITGSIDNNTLTVVIKENKGVTDRNGSVTVVVAGREFQLPIRQASASGGTGTLTLDQSFYMASFLGDTITITAVDMPSGTEELTCRVNITGGCTNCSIDSSFVKPSPVSKNKVKLVIEPQDLFEGEERSATVVFEAGDSTANFTLTQSAPPAVYKLRGQADKFRKSVTSDTVFTVLTESTAEELYLGLKDEEWVKTSAFTVSDLVSSSWDSVASNPSKYDVYKTSYGLKSGPAGTTHKLTMGAVAYRFVFAEEAYGQTLRGLSFNVRSDGFNIAGLRVSLEIATGDDPSDSWDSVRDGTGTHSRQNVAQRIFRPQNSLYYGVTQTVVFDGLDAEIDADTRIYVYVTMEDYKGVVNGRMYGSGVIVPTFNFYADSLIGGLTENDIITVSEIPTTSARYRSSAVRFVRRYDAPSLTPVSSAPSTANDLQRQLDTAPWRQVPTQMDATFPPPHADVPYHDAKVSDWYDAYFGCDEHQGDVQKMHRGHVGSVCYRITLPNLSETNRLLSVKMRCVCDQFALEGARVSVSLSEISVPSEQEWFVRNGDAFVSGAGRNNIGEVTGEEVVVNIPPGTQMERYVLIYLSIETPPYGHDGWLDGSAYLMPEFELFFSELIDDALVDGHIGGGYADVELPEMVLSGGELPAPWSMVPFREVASIEHELWVDPPIPSHLELSVIDKWIGQEGGTFVVVITSLPDNAVDFDLTSELPSWITATVNKQTSRVTFSVSATELGQSRSADIVFSSLQETATLHIDQQADPITYLELSMSTRQFQNNADNDIITVVSLPNGVVDFSVEVVPSSATWLTTSVNTDKITISVTEQVPGASQRYAEVVVTAGTSTKSVLVSQLAGPVKTYLVLKNSYAYSGATDGRAGNIPILSLPNGVSISEVIFMNVPYWASVTVDTVNSRISWTTDQNIGGERSAKVNVLAGDNNSSFTLTQGANSKAFSVTPRYNNPTISYAGGTVDFKVQLPEGVSTYNFTSNDGLTGISFISENDHYVRVTVPENTSPPRTVSGVVSIDVDGTEHTAQVDVYQGGVVNVDANYTLAIMKTDDMEAFKVNGADTSVSGITSLNSYGGVLVANGTFSNMFSSAKGICVFDVRGTNPTIYDYSQSDSQPNASFIYKGNLYYFPAIDTTHEIVNSGVSTSYGAHGFVISTTQEKADLWMFGGTSSEGETTNPPSWHLIAESGSVGKQVSGTNKSNVRCGYNGSFSLDITDKYKDIRVAWNGKTGILVRVGAKSIVTIGGSGTVKALEKGVVYHQVGDVEMNKLKVSQTVGDLGQNISAITPYGTSGFLVAVSSGGSYLRYMSDAFSTPKTTYTSNNKIPPTGKLLPVKNRKVDFTGFSMVVDTDGHLVVAGDFTSIGGDQVKYLAKWVGSNWVPYGDVELNGPVTAMALTSDGLVIAGSWGGYKKVLPPQGTGGLDMDPEDTLPPIPMDEGQIVCGVRDMYAQAFAERIVPLNFTEQPRPSRQIGIGASLIRGGDDRLRLGLSSIMCHLEVPTTFVPSKIKLSSPPMDILQVPEGTFVTLTAWWAADKYMEMEEISALSSSGFFWSGLKTSIDGVRSITLGHVTYKVNASVKRVGSVNMDNGAWALQEITMPIYGVTGRYGTLLITAWLHAYGIQAVPYNSVFGVGKLDVGNLAGTSDLCWRPAIRLAP